MESESDEHTHWNCPPVRPPRRNDLCDFLGLDDPEEVDVKDVKTYEEYNTKYFNKHGGDDTSSSIEEYTGESPIDKEFVKNHEAPVGQIRWNDEIDHFDGTSTDLTEYAGLRECSGTLIDDELFLTAGHSFVIDGGPPPARVAKQMHVTFDYQDGDGKPSQGDSYDVVGLEEQVFQHAGLDYAILRLKGDHDSEFETDEVPGDRYETATVAYGDAEEGAPICIIGHPNGLPKRVAAGEVTHLHDVRIGYDDINTAPGSSGAGILDGTGKLVGVHSESGIGINKGHNHGVRISAILSVSPALRSLVEGPYVYESHGMFVDSRRSTVEPICKSGGERQKKGK